MKILVTGHHGYIGSVLAPMLRDAGNEVVGLDTYYYRGCGLSGSAFDPAIARDIRAVAAVDLEGFDAVVHLAALSNDPLGDLDADMTYAINFDGTIGLARAAKEAGVERFVFASSCSIYGAADPDELVGEDDPLRPLTAYAETKVRAEEELRGLGDAGFSPVSMRNATAYGMSPRLRLDIVLNNLVAWAHTTGAIRLLSDGRSWRPLVHIRDIARATVALLEAPAAEIAGEAFNIGSAEQNYRVGELAEIVRRRLPRCDVKFAGDASPDPRSYRVDFSKFAEQFPGFEYEWTAERGTDELAEAYERVGLSLEEFEGDGYIRLSRLKRLLASGALDGDLQWNPTGRTEPVF